MAVLPIDIINKINEYIPIDRLMRSPTAECIYPYIILYNIWGFYPYPFYKFALGWDIKL